MARSTVTDHSEATTPFARGRLLVVALLGWNDAGDAASSAVRALQEAIGADRLIEDIDDESFFDYSIHRPVMRAGTEGSGRSSGQACPSREPRSRERAG